MLSPFKGGVQCVFFKLPDLGEGIPEADIVKWHVKPGDQVEEDQLLVSVETAKAVVDVPSPQTGVIGKLFGEPGDTLHTGEPLVEFAGVEEEDTGTVVGKLEEAPESADDEQFFVGASPSTAESQRVRATPAVRALAQRLGVDINTVQASSPTGNITTEDVEKAAYTSPLGDEAETLRGVRKHMARNMAASVSPSYRSHCLMMRISDTGKRARTLRSGLCWPLLRLAGQNRR